MNTSDISKSMNMLTHGVYILGVHTPGKDNLMTAAWLCQTSGRPASIAVCVSKPHLTASLIEESGRFTVSILKKDQIAAAKACGFSSGRNTDKTTLVTTAYTQDGIPYLENAAAVLSCRVTEINMTATDHAIVFAAVEEAEYTGGETLLYRAGEFFS